MLYDFENCKTELLQIVILTYKKIFIIVLIHFWYFFVCFLYEKSRQAYVKEKETKKKIRKKKYQTLF